MTYTGHNNGVRALTFSSDGMKIVSGSLDSTARLWDVATGNCERLFLVRSQLLSVAISRNGSRILTGSADNFVRVWPTTYTAGTKPQPLLQPHRDIRFLFANSRSLVFKVPKGAALASGASVRLYALDGSLLFDLPASRSAAADELAAFALPIRLAAGMYVYYLSGVRSKGRKEVTGIFTVCR
jgi:WD40 repeat protein